MLFSCIVCMGTKKRIEKDLNEDYKIDQVLIYGDDGTIIKVETDQDHDGSFERIQFYTKGVLNRLERDTDGDKEIDTIDHHQG